MVGYILIRYSIESGYMIDMDEGGKHGRSTAIRVIAAMTLIGVISGSSGIGYQGIYHLV